MKKYPNHPTRKLYTSELDIPEEHIDAFVNWYAFRHAPDIYQIGFDVCTSYRGIAGDMMMRHHGRTIPAARASERSSGST